MVPNFAARHRAAKFVGPVEILRYVTSVVLSKGKASTRVEVLKVTYLEHVVVKHAKVLFVIEAASPELIGGHTVLICVWLELSCVTESPDTEDYLHC